MNSSYTCIDFIVLKPNIDIRFFINNVCSRHNNNVYTAGKLSNSIQSIYVQAAKFSYPEPNILKPFVSKLLKYKTEM